MARRPAADYVIVGAGSAGCVLAHRLTAAGARVDLIEHGGSDFSPLIAMPGALSYPMNMARYDWGYVSEPQQALNNRRLACPRGKVLGGSSSINGMVYVRGHACDFDHWVAMGAEGWGYRDVLPYFRRLEDWHPGGHGGDPAMRGQGGPMHVTRGRRHNPLNEAFVHAAVEAGYAHTDDYNGVQQEGFGPMDRTIWRGRRWSAARAFLRPALGTGRCRLIRGLALGLDMDRGAARGVVVAAPSGPDIFAATAEVVLSAGAINSPKLLMLSGIGPADHLAAHSIDVVADRPGVGRNMQDHLEVYFQFEARQALTLAPWWNLFGKATAGAWWLANKGGPGASNQFETGGFIRSRAGVEYPDIQFHFLPIAVRYDGRAAVRGHGFQVHVGPMRSGSRGAVTLRSARPEDAPLIDFNYMNHVEDFPDFRRALRLTREIFAQPAMQAHVKGEMQPGEGVISDNDLDAFVRAHAESAYHPCGTCRMGAADDPGAVVDPQGRVIGIDRLRVVDSSLFPRITNGNINAPTLMLAEKMADHILGHVPLPPEDHPVWLHPQWHSVQR